MSPCSEKERATGGCARQAEASVPQDNIGPDNKTRFFFFHFIKGFGALAFSWDIPCISELRHKNLMNQNSVRAAGSHPLVI